MLRLAQLKAGDCPQQQGELQGEKANTAASAQTRGASCGHRAQMEPRERGCHFQPSPPDREVGGKPMAPQGKRVLSSLAALLYSPYVDRPLSGTVTLSLDMHLQHEASPHVSRGGPGSWQTCLSSWHVTKVCLSWQLLTSSINVPLGERETKVFGR